nr:response regulator [uncultured Shinella sp.]
MDKVLVVEDDTLIRLTIIDALHDAGFEVFEASDGEVALKIINQHTIDFLFTDIQLPGDLTGVDVAHAVAERCPDAGIIVTSGRLTSEDIALPLRAEFISKPYSFTMIAARLSAIAHR